LLLQNRCHSAVVIRWAVAGEYREYSTLGFASPPLVESGTAIAAVAPQVASTRASQRLTGKE